jgi:hypothetical protein
LFDPEDYFKRIDNALRTCHNAKIERNTLRVSPEVGGWGKWETIYWRFVIKWDSGERLDISDFFQRRRRREIFRTFRYHFMDGDSGCIFRLDTHGDPIAFDACCHVHIGPKEEVFEDDDARLRGYPLSGKDFLDAFNLVHRHLKRKSMPWEL